MTRVKDEIGVQGVLEHTLGLQRIVHLANGLDARMSLIVRHRIYLKHVTFLFETRYFLP